jgi:hypothetical protein
MPRDVFISYSTRDKATADAVCHALEAVGIRCWIAPRDALPGRKYQGSIVRALRECRVMVLVFSAGSNESDHVTREVSIAAELGKPVVPFRIEAVEMNDELYFYISSVHWLDALSPPMERHIERLVQAVSALVPTSGRIGPQHTAPRPTAPATRRKVVGLAGVGIFALLLIGFLVHGRSESGMEPPFERAASIARDQAHAEAVNDGVEAYHAGDVSAAVGHWQRAIEVSDRRPEAHLYLASVYIAEERHEDAIAAFRSALAALGRDPGRTLTAQEEAEREEFRFTTLYQLGSLEFNTEQFGAAEHTFRRLAELRPGDPRGWANYLSALYVQQRWEEIVPAAEHLLELDPLNDNAHLFLAWAFRETDQPSRALVMLDRRAALPVQVRDLQLREDAGRVTLQGIVVGNRARQGAPIRLEFTFFGPENTPLRTDTVAASAPAKEATTTVQLTIPTETMPTGFRYRLLDQGRENSEP